MATMIRLQRDHWEITVEVTAGAFAMTIGASRGMVTTWTDGDNDPPCAIAGASIDLPTISASVRYPWRWHERLSRDP